jgi:hypothetical protein
MTVNSKASKTVTDVIVIADEIAYITSTTCQLHMDTVPSANRSLSLPGVEQGNTSQTSQ